MDALRISPRYTSSDWQRLDSGNPKDWTKAVEIVRDRLNGRFLRFASDCLKVRDSGFVVLAIDCLLAETIQQFKDGVTDGRNRSAEMITRFLEGLQFQPDFNADSRKAFYLDIRCGLLHQGPTGQWEYGETKRAGSRRIIRLQNWIIAKLKDLKRHQEENPVVDPEEWPEAVDLVFVTEFGRPVNANSLVYKHFKPILKKAGLPNIRLYDLRHTAATLALSVGVSPKVVSEQLGHTSAAFTLDVYSHVLPHMQDDAAAKVEAALMSA